MKDSRTRPRRPRPLVPLRAGPLAIAVALAGWPALLPAAEPDEPPVVTAPAPAELPLARFAVPDGAPAELVPLLARVVDAARLSEGVDPEDDERLLRRLRRSAIEVLATEGYFSPQVTVGDDGERRARYLLRVEPGLRTRVRAIDITLRGPIEQRPERIRELLDGWELDVGAEFRDSAWSAAKARLLARVQQRDYPAARIADSQAEVDADDAAARLTLVIDSGPAFTLGALQVRGLARYDEALVHRFSEFELGEPYDATRLLEFQRRMQQAPYFSTVLVEVAADPAAPTEVPIVVTVREAPSKRISTGVGFSTNTGARLEATYRHVGLFSHPYTLQSGFGIDQTRAIVYADLLLPPKPNGALDSIGVLAERTDIENLITRRWAVGVARADSPGGLPSAGGASYDNRISLKAQRESVRERGAAPETEFTNDTLTLANTWTRRTVDSLTDPRRGDVLALTGAFGVSRAGLSNLLSEAYFHAYGRYVRYLPLFGQHQLILRGEIGHVVADDLRFVPLDYRFRTGGAGSVRGYQYQSLGVPTEAGAVVGARSLAVGSAEYVHWLTPRWGGALFYDVGDADNDLLRIRWARGYGAGARWRTLAGPLALDLAYGERDRKWRVHFAIAIAF